MIKKAVILGLLTFFLFSNSYSQNTIDSIKNNTAILENKNLIDSIKTIYDREAIYINGNGKYFQNGNKYQIGFLGSNLKKEFQNSEEATYNIHEYRSHFVKGLTVDILGCVGTIALISATLNPACILILIPTTILTISELNQSITHFNKSIWAYNRDIVIQRIKERKAKIKQQ